ncbi:hypothetical protein [Kitasatospora sp. McL0602]|uniref:hypothetical protein n=1 Tax=Kitasatospora sp. McL0602 TaxID=3439530 RepID=UPI003F8C57B7
MTAQPTTSVPTTSVPTIGAIVYRAGTPVPFEESVAQGFLASLQSVMVPLPTQLLADPWPRLVVRIVQDPDLDGGPETIAVSGISLSALDGDGLTSAFALLTLTGPSRHTDAVPPTTRRALTDSVRRNEGDLWNAYAELGFPITRPDGLPPVDTWWLGSATKSLGYFVSDICCQTVPHTCACTG